MSANLTAEEICGLAFVICQAAAPTPPAFAPETAIEERAQRWIDWDIDSDYEDEHIRIAIGGARSSKERKKGFEIYIGLANQPESRETDHLTVFIGYELFGDDQDSATEDVPIDVEVWKPGPWMDHLVTVARRALPIVQSRMRDQGER